MHLNINSCENKCACLVWGVLGAKRMNNNSKYLLFGFSRNFEALKICKLKHEQCGHPIKWNHLEISVEISLEKAPRM